MEKNNFLKRITAVALTGSVALLITGVVVVNGCKKDTKVESEPNANIDKLKTSPLSSSFERSGNEDPPHWRAFYPCHWRAFFQRVPLPVSTTIFSNFKQNIAWWVLFNQPQFIDLQIVVLRARETFARQR